MPKNWKSENDAEDIIELTISIFLRDLLLKAMAQFVGSSPRCHSLFRPCGSGCCRPASHGAPVAATQGNATADYQVPR